MWEAPSACAKKILGNLGIAGDTKPELQRVVLGVHRSIQIPPHALHLNLGFVDAPGIGGGVQVRSAASIQQRCRVLHPPKDRRVVDVQSSFQQLFQIAIAERIYQRTQSRTRSRADGSSLRKGGQMLAASSSTHALHGAPGGTAPVIGRAEKRGVCTVTGCVPSGVMLLGATLTIAHTPGKVKLRFTRGEVIVNSSLGLGPALGQLQQHAAACLFR